MTAQNSDNAGWHHPGSEYTRSSKVRDGKEIAVCSGRYILNEIEMVFSATEQLSGKYALRGTISAISPQDGLVLQVSGREKNARLEHLVQSGKYHDREESIAHRDKALNVSYPVYGHGLSDAEAKAAVENAAIKLFAKHAPLLQQVLRQSSRPDSIMPNVAFSAYADDFLSSQFSDASVKSRANYRSQLAKLLRKLPNSPMSKVKPSEVGACIKHLNYSKSETRRAYLFWQFLLDHGYCTGSNPVPSNTKRRESAETRQEKSKRPDCLDLPQQDALYKALTAGEVSGADCGVALMAWGGIDIKRGLTWQSVHFHSDDPTLAVIDIHQPDLAGATHDYTRPVAPFCALILMKRYQALQEKYTAEELMEAPVVSTKKNAQKALSNEAFLGEATRLLRAIAPDTIAGKKKNGGTAAAKRVLQNTYINNVYTRLGFNDDVGTKAFLCEERIKDVTSDNYTKFNDLDGVARIHAAEMILSPPETIDNTEQAEALPDGRIKYTFWPDTMRKTVGVNCVILSPPNAEIDLSCPHGTESVIKSRELKEDGSPKRKSGKRTKRSKFETSIKNDNGEPPKKIEPNPEGEIPVCFDQQVSPVQEQLISQTEGEAILLPSEEVEGPCVQTKQRGPKKEPLIQGQDSLF